MQSRTPKLLGAGVALAGLLASTLAAARPPESNALGFEFTLLSAGPPATVELRLSPKHDFDAVSVEAASGVATLAPACAFAKLVAGAHYSCRVSLTGTAAAAAMSLNVLGRRQLAGARVAETESHHLSVKNPAFVPSARSQAASRHVLSGPAAPAPK